MHDEVLMQLWLEKSDEAMRDCQLTIDAGAFSTAQNRLYYAIFYAVSALAKANNWATSKHGQLVGWFNKNYVNTEAFPEQLATVYRNAFERRQKSDYSFTYTPTKAALEQDIAEARRFVDEIKRLIQATT